MSRSRSWGHRIEAVTPDHRVGNALVEQMGIARRTASEMTCGNGKRCPGKSRRDLGGPRWYTVGGTPVTHVASYRYITGRAGRVSTHERYLCAPCAAQWIAKHLPESPVVVESRETEKDADQG